MAEFGLVRPAIAPNAGPSRLCLIDRDFTSRTDDELAAAAVRSKLCVSWWLGLRWIESFYDRASAAVTCAYEARTEQSMRDHAETAHLPISAIHEVELTPLRGHRGAASGCRPGAFDRLDPLVSRLGLGGQTAESMPLHQNARELAAATDADML